MDKELEIAITLARKAGKKILEYYALEIVAEQKLGIDNYYEPVTEADRSASRIIVDGLAEAFPYDAILSEEEDDVIEVRLGRDRAWIVDPIDGTSGFLKKDGDFAVQIGLADKGTPLVGVVFLPFYDRLYYAAAGRGAFVVAGGEERRLSVSAETEFRDMTLAYSRFHASPAMKRILREFKFGKAVQRGSVGLKIGLIAESECDMYIHLSPRTKLWDTCGPQVILEEAGGRVTDLFGGELRYDVGDVQNHGGIVASNGAAHERAIQRLQPILNDIGRARRGTAAG